MAGVMREDADPGDGARHRRPLWQRVLLVLASIAGTVVLLGAALYNFGGMGSSAYDPAIQKRYEQLVQAGEITPVQEKFVIPIPGCTCHSTNPRLTEEHRSYRMNECMESGCHS